MQEWTAPDGTRLGWKEWLPAGGPPRARVIGLHGMSCCTDDFAPLAETLAAHGIAAAAWNLRGQGLDPVVARRGDWLDVEGQLADLEAFANFWATDELPVFFWGDSMGALLSLQAAVRKPWAQRLVGALLFVPVAGLAQKNPPWVKGLLRGISRRLPWLRLSASWFVHGRPSTPKLTRIPERQHYVETSPCQLGPVTFGYLASMGDLIEAALPAAERLEVPVALFSAGHDAFIKPDQTRGFFAHVHSRDKTHFHYADAYHQLLFDLDAARVLADAAGWIEARLPSRSGVRVGL
jgi:alpha-beta hydrolase superfamily lysophospholipase